LPAKVLAGVPICELHNHEETEGSLRVLGFSSSVNQPTFLGTIQPRYGVHGKGSSIVSGDLAITTIDGLTFPFNFLPTSRDPSLDPDSCTFV